MSSFTSLDYALHYSQQLNWAVFPCHSITETGKCTCGDATCKSAGKHPQTSHGSTDATADEETVRRFFPDDGTANIGIATGTRSNLVVVDVDEAKGGKIDDLFFDDVDQDAIEGTLQVRTGGGWHFYYRLPPGIVVKNSAGKLAPFIDVRGEGGYVIAPPSKHVSGRSYEIGNPGVKNILQFPKAWLNRLVDNRPSPLLPVATADASEGSLVVPTASSLILPESIDQGKRNVELTRIAGAMRSKGLSETAIYAALRVENERICKPPLDDAEIHTIARSVGRYRPHNALTAVADNAASEEDYENTLKPYLFGEFLNQVFEEKEILGFHIGKRDIAIIQAATNAGKTTLLRNITLCMAAGRPFQPFFDGVRPVKAAYFDFESDAQDVQRDLRDMVRVFTPTERALIDRNLIVIPKGLKDGDLFQFNRHEAWANELITRNGVEFVIVDNVSAAYDINDENSNAEVTRKIIKPLLKMAYKGDCAFLFAHHYGKTKIEQDNAGVHAGRGASALQALSRTVINMFGNVSEGETITVACAKRKTDGGQNYSISLKLEDDRWFHHATKVPAPQKLSAYKTIRTYMSDIYPSQRTTGDLITEFENRFSERQIKGTVAELYKDGFLDRPKRGVFCSRPKGETNVVNFYETS